MALDQSTRSDPRLAFGATLPPKAPPRFSGAKLLAAVYGILKATGVMAKEKYQPAKTSIGVGLAAACLIAFSSSQALAARATSYDIVEFSCSEEKDVGEVVELAVKVRRKGSTGTGTTLTISGTQGGTGVFSDSHTILDESRDKEAEETYLFNPDSTGDIQWLVVVEGDEAHCTTTVLQGDDDGDGGGGGGTSDNIIALHDSGSPQYDKNCLECHAGIPSEGSLELGIHGAHMTMRNFVPGEDDEEKCAWCHRTVDLTAALLGPQPSDKTSANLRKHVDVRLCTVCHGNPARSTARQFYQVGLFPADPDGPALYDLTCAACHRDLAQSEVKGKKADEITEKILKDEGGMGPLDVLTAEEIQAIADALVE